MLLLLLVVVDDGLCGNEAGFINTDACFVAHADNFAIGLKGCDIIRCSRLIDATFSEWDLNHVGFFSVHPSIDGDDDHPFGASHAEVHRFGVHRTTRRIDRLGPEFSG